ncbi:cytochrome c [candidate division KSB1 bacterium]|nr:cytochrome c [candidate division KSB1 bacterium]
MIHNRILVKTIIIGILLLVVTAGCFRGRPKRKPPVHLVPDMDLQQKYKTQGPGEFFPNGVAMRLPVAGTVARGSLSDNIAYTTGKDKNGVPVKDNPVEVTPTGLNRGGERYDIYCSPCHSRIGDGKGIMLSRGYVPPPDFHTEQYRKLPDGHLFDVISNGIRNMPSYAHQIPVEDRWLIVSYIRALQKSQNAGINDVPEENRNQLK